VWTLLQRLQMHGGEIAPFLPARRGARAKRLSASSEAIIQQAIDQHYAKPARPSLPSLANEIAGHCNEPYRVSRRRFCLSQATIGSSFNCSK
ncbi:MAG: hypothetical protein M3Y22_00500, partial [Pseudomonadota bacterium]|nr:hypothetical protein [Pseudomonadota bacterium]